LEKEKIAGGLAAAERNQLGWRFSLDGSAMMPASRSVSFGSSSTDSNGEGTKRQRTQRPRSAKGIAIRVPLPYRAVRRNVHKSLQIRALGTRIRRPFCGNFTIKCTSSGQSLPGISPV
jgi:hypothetical protein